MERELNSKKKCKLTVDEPWEFSRQYFNGKTNVLQGEVVERLSPKEIIFKTTEPLHDGVETSRYLILATRHVGQTFEEILNDEIYVNGALFLGDTYEGKSMDALMTAAKFILVGRFEKLK